MKSPVERCQSGFGALLLVLLLQYSAVATAADPDLGRNLAATCANCHGTDGKSVGGIEPLAGLPKDKILRSMKEFKSGEKPATIMHQLAKGYSDAQIEAVAAYFSSRQ